MSKDKYIGPRTGRTYDLANGDKIDVEAEGLGYANQYSSPDATVNGKRVYKRIFVRLLTPYETLTCNPIKDGKDFANRVAIIESWFDSVICKGNYVLTFEAMQITDDEADEIERSGQTHPKPDKKL